MSHSKQCKTRQDNSVDMPEFYMPAMWPFDLQNFIVDCWAAWRWRRQMRRLLQEEASGRARLGSARAAVAHGAQERLTVIVARFAARRRLRRGERP
jgi:hypothetical protein